LEATEEVTQLTRDDLCALDASDPIAAVRGEFVLPAGLLYLDGNSLGALPRAALDRVIAVTRDEWGQDLIRNWRGGARWWDRPSELGARLAPLLGARPDEVIVCDSTSINLFKVITAALAMRPGRRAIVSDPNSFPSDLYILESVADMLGHELRLVDCRGPGLDAALDGDAAALVLSHVDYVTAEVEDMAGATLKAHEAGALAVWDVSHSVGAIPVNLGATDVDLAVGCTYKYLNGGPGSPAFVFAAQRLQAEVRQPLSGWNAHARPFSFERDFVAAPGVERFRTGTPPMLAYAALEAALEIWGGVDLAAVFEKGGRLGDLFLELVEQRLADPDLRALSPREAKRRGSHVAYRHPRARELIADLDALGVLADYREAGVMRFGLAPLYLRYVDVWDAVGLLGQALAG